MGKEYSQPFAPTPGCSPTWPFPPTGLDLPRNIRIRGSASGTSPLDASCHRLEESDLPGGEQLLFSPRGEILVVGHPFPRYSEATWLAIWDVSTGKLIRAQQPDPHGSCLAISADGTRLVSASSGHTLLLRETATLQERAVLVGHTGPINGADFSLDGKSIASASSDRTIRLWCVASGKELLTLKGHTGPVSLVRFSHDGRTLASAADSIRGKGEIFIWHYRDLTGR